MTEIDLEMLVKELSRWREGRQIIAISGPPGAGKSFFADLLSARLPNTAIVPMDGFHFDDAVLEARNLRPRKGAPHTFDVRGLESLLARLRKNTEAEIAVPVFDRELEISRNAARVIARDVQHIIVEGNYLLLRKPPWDGLARFFDRTVFLDVPEPVLCERLEARWRDMTPEARAVKLEENDFPNMRLVLEESARAEFAVKNF